MAELIECIINISEGRNRSLLSSMENAITENSNSQLLHTDSGFDAHRTVFTIVGSKISLKKSLFHLFEVALSNIDMRNHRGTHPRLGAVDVCPFVALSGITADELIQWVDDLAHELSSHFKLPIYLYQKSATAEEYTKLESVRNGEYESLSWRYKNADMLPDIGAQFGFAKCGATIMGVRDLLIAYNVNLPTTDVSIAKDIAKRIRGSGFVKDGRRILGKFHSVKAIGWLVEEYSCTQVSTNLTKFSECSMHHVFEACKELAADHGLEVTGSELIGLAPRLVFIEAGRFYSKNLYLSENELINIAVKHLGLSAIKPFNASERIIEELISR